MGSSDTVASAAGLATIQESVIAIGCIRVHPIKKKRKHTRSSDTTAIAYTSRICMGGTERVDIVNSYDTLGMRHFQRGSDRTCIP